MTVKKFQGPWWMREPVPPEDRIRFLDLKTCIERLGNGEKIRYHQHLTAGCGVKAPKIQFIDDRWNVHIKQSTYDALQRRNLIPSAHE